MVVRGHSVLILTLLGLMNPDVLASSSTEAPVPQAPVPAISPASTPVDEMATELSKLSQDLHTQLLARAQRQETVQPTPSQAGAAQPAPETEAKPVAQPTGITEAQPAAQVKPGALPDKSAMSALRNERETPSRSKTNAKTDSTMKPAGQAGKSSSLSAARATGTKVSLKPLDQGYVRLDVASMGEAPKAQVAALAERFQPAASGRDGLPIDWLPRESRKRLGGPGPRDVVLIAATSRHAWYVWAEREEAMIGRIAFSDLATVEAGPIPLAGAFQVPGDEVLFVDPSGVLEVTDRNGSAVSLKSR